MKFYTVIFLFNSAADKVLLLQKNHGPYTGA